MTLQNRVLAFTCLISLYFFGGGDHQTNTYVGVSAEVGGHDLFTSLAQLEVLWHNELKIVSLMERMVKKIDRAKASLQQ